MKIAVILKGISYKSKHMHHTRREICIDWRLSCNNIKDNVIQDLLDSGHTVHIYLSTYDNETTAELLEFYNPAKYVLSDSQKNQLQCTLNILQDITEAYDIYIITRFDIEFKKKISEVVDVALLEDNTIYVPFKECRDNLVGDCFIFIPHSQLELFKKTIKRLETLHHRSMHYLCRHCQTKPIIDGLYDSNTDKMSNPLYRLVRYSTAPYVPTKLKNMQAYFPIGVLNHRSWSFF